MNKHRASITYVKSSKDFRIAKAFLRWSWILQRDDDQFENSRLSFINQKFNRREEVYRALQVNLPDCYLTSRIQKDEENIPLQEPH